MSISALKLSVFQPPKINCNYQYQDAELQSILSSRLLQALQLFSEKLLKPIYLLTSVNMDLNDCLEHSLQKDQYSRGGQRIIIIPCDLGDLHWVGILIEFTNDGIKRAEYFDPAKQVNSVPIYLQQQFAKVYNNNVLQFKSLLKSPNTVNCGVYLIENLVLAVQGLEQQQSLTTTKELRQLQLNSLKYYDFTYYSKFYRKQRYN